MQGYCGEASQLSTKDMLLIEDVPATALPPTTDVDGTVRGAAKCSQIGMDGIMQVVNGMLDGGTLDAIDGHSGLVFVDLTPGVGELFDVFISKQATLMMPTFYFAMTTHPNNYNFLSMRYQDKLRTLHMEGKLTVPGYPAACREMPADMLEAAPTMPALHRLVCKSGETSTHPKMVVPKEIIDMWAAHPQFGPRFTGFLEQFYEEFGCHAEDDMQTTPPKRNHNNNNDPETPPPNKRPKISLTSTEHIMAITQAGNEPVLKRWH